MITNITIQKTKTKLENNENKTKTKLNRIIQMTFIN